MIPERITLSNNYIKIYQKIINIFISGPFCSLNIVMKQFQKLIRDIAMGFEQDFAFG